MPLRTSAQERGLVKTENVREAQERIDRRLMDTGEMDSRTELRLPGWSVGALHSSATDTAQATLDLLAADPDAFLAVLMAEQSLNAIIEGFMGPFFEQCHQAVKENEENPDVILAFSLKTSALTAFVSLALAPIPTNSTPKPTIPVPAATDEITVVSDADVLWWAIIAVMNQLPESVRTVLAEETGLNFEEIR